MDSYGKNDIMVETQGSSKWAKGGRKAGGVFNMDDRVYVRVIFECTLAGKWKMKW